MKNKKQKIYLNFWLTAIAFLICSNSIFANENIAVYSSLAYSPANNVAQSLKQHIYERYGIEKKLVVFSDIYDAFITHETPWIISNDRAMWRHRNRLPNHFLEVMEIYEATQLGFDSSFFVR